MSRRGDSNHGDAPVLATLTSFDMRVEKNKICSGAQDL
jgi:hypothetical protein